MALLTEKIHEAANTVSRNATANTSGYCIALVTEADEGTNLCNVSFSNQVTGAREDKVDVPVDLRNHQAWFPKKGDVVLLDNSSKTGMIVSLYTESYSEIRSNFSLTQDILADGSTGLCEGSIL